MFSPQFGGVGIYNPNLHICNVMDKRLERAMNAKIEQVLEELHGPGIVLLFSDPQDTQEMNARLLSYFINKGYHGIALASSQPFDRFEKAIGEKESQNIFFIDTFTRYEPFPERSDRHIYIDNPSSLTDIGIAITESIKSLPEGKRFLLLDSISSIAIHTNVQVFAKFSHFLAGKMREHKIVGVFMSATNSMDEQMVSAISQFADKTIDLTDGKSSGD